MFPPVVDSEVVHVDGGIINNLPADIIRDMGVGFVVGVDVGGSPADGLARVSEVAAKMRRPNIFEILMRVGTISSDARAKMDQINRRMREMRASSSSSVLGARAH